MGALLAVSAPAHAVTGDLIVIIVYYLVGALTVAWAVAVPIAVMIRAEKKLSCLFVCGAISGLTALAVVLAAHFIADLWFGGQYPEEPGKMWLWQLIYAGLSALGFFITLKASRAVRRYNDGHD